MRGYERTRIGNVEKSTTEGTWKKPFIAALSVNLSVTRACEIAGVGRSRVYAARDRDPEFARAWKEALDSAVDRIEEAAFVRAVEGVDRPIYWQGQKVGTEKRYSDTLTALLLKSWRPERYGDQALQSGGPGLNVPPPEQQELKPEVVQKYANLFRRIFEQVASDEEGLSPQESDQGPGQAGSATL